MSTQDSAENDAGCVCSAPADPICNERGTPESECPPHCAHGRAFPPVEGDTHECAGCSECEGWTPDA